MQHLPKIIISWFVFFTIATSAHAEEKQNVFILTSSPDYKVMNLVTSDSFVAQTPMVEKRTFKFTTFVDAYMAFNNNVNTYITNSAQKHNLAGVCNLKIQHNVYDGVYYFSASWDFFKFK